MELDVRTLPGFLVLLAASVALQFLLRRYVFGADSLERLLLESVVLGSAFAVSYSLWLVAFDR